MAYLPGFDYDLFVSYAHGPGQGEVKDDHLRAWTIQLAKDLKFYIDVHLGLKDPSTSFKIWIDPEIRSNHPLTDTIKDTIKRSGLFLAVMSHFYLTSRWCLDEVAWFAGLPERGPVSNRIFVARAFHTTHSEWPAALKDSAGNAQPGIRLHSPPEGPGDIGWPYGFPFLQSGDQNYQDRVKQLAREIAEQARSLKAAPPPKRHDRPVGPLSGRHIFLGCVHDTLDDQRSEVRRALEALGATVHPPPDQEPGDQATLQEAMAEHLAQCHALILLANEYGGGKWPRGQEGGFVGLQIEAAKASGKPALLWLQLEDLKKLKFDNQAEFFDKLMKQPGDKKVKVISQVGDVGSFVRRVQDLLSSAPAITGTAVLCSNLTKEDDDRYITLEASVRSALRENGLIFCAQRHQRENAQKRVLALSESIRNGDNVLILCFDQDIDWVFQLLRQFMTLGAGPQDDKGKIIIIGPQAEEDDDIDASSLGFQTLHAVGLPEDVLRARIAEMVRKRSSPFSVGRSDPMNGPGFWDGR